MRRPGPPDPALPGRLPHRRAAGAPAALLSFTARQLSGYGIRFASVTEDLLQYQKEDFAVVLLASSRRKADALQAMLREKRVFSAVDERLHDLPAPGRITIAVGGAVRGL